MSPPFARAGGARHLDGTGTVERRREGNAPHLEERGRPAPGGSAHSPAAPDPTGSNGATSPTPPRPRAPRTMTTLTDTPDVADEHPAPPPSIGTLPGLT